MQPVTNYGLLSSLSYSTPSLIQSVTRTEVEEDVLCTLQSPANPQSPSVAPLRLKFSTESSPSMSSLPSKLEYIPPLRLHMSNSTVADVTHNHAMTDYDAVSVNSVELSAQIEAVDLGYNVKCADFASPSDIDDDDDSHSTASSHSESESSAISEESLELSTLLTMLEDTNEDILMAQHGLKILHRICDTSQGELLKGQITKITENMKGHKVGDFVAIKKIDEASHRNKEVADNDGTVYFVDKDVAEEAAVLKALSADPRALRHIAGFIDFFVSDSSLYLVTEYVDGVPSNDLIRTAFSYIREGRLTRSEWAKTAEDIMAELMSIVKYLHSVHCCHLDLCTQNVIVQGISFKEQPDGRETVEGTARAKLVDFGMAKIFKASSAEPDQMQSPRTDTRLTFSREIEQCPESQFGDTYNAVSADMWSLGMMLYRTMVGEALFRRMDDSSYEALHSGALFEFLDDMKLADFFTPRSFSLLLRLLDLNPVSRANAI